MARILGLDLGSYTVKALVIETGVRGARQLSFFEVRRAEGDKLESLSKTLKTLTEEHPASGDSTVVALPGATLAMHALALPFTDAKRIDATLPFELESQLPFELSDAIYDYQTLPRKEAKANVLAGVVLKEELEGLLSTLSGAEIDPRVVTHPALTYHNIFAFEPQLLGNPTSSDAVAIVDIGHERTCVAVGRPTTGIEWARTFAGGGKDLTRTLAAEFRTPLPEANAWKESQGAIGAAAQGPEGERASAALQRGLLGIVREVRGTFKSYAATSRSQVTKVYLCGGTARLPGLPEQLASDLATPVSLLSMPQEVDAVVPGRQLPSVAQAYSLALRGMATGSRAPRFNLRRGPYAFKRDTDTARDQLLRLGAFGAALFALFLIFSVTRSTLLSRREHEVDHQLCQITEKVLGRCEANYDRALNLLRGKEGPGEAIPKRSAVSLLAELTERVPQDLPVKFNQMDIDLERLMLRGETDNPSRIDNLERAIKGSPCFKEVKEGKVEKARGGSGVQFRLDVRVDCPDTVAQP